jgi:carbon monoxide dehydrogenase subunit G
MAAAEVEFHLAIHSEIAISASPEVVWDYLDRPRDWKPSIVSIERLEGQPGQEGEILRIGQRPAHETVYVIMRTLRVEPYAWRVQTLSTEASRATDGFVIYRLLPEGASTRLACDVVARCAIAAGATGGRAPAEFARSVNEATAGKLDVDHRALKALIEQGR